MNRSVQSRTVSVLLIITYFLANAGKKKNRIKKKQNEPRAPLDLFHRTDKTQTKRPNSVYIMTQLRTDNIARYTRVGESAGF